MTQFLHSSLPFDDYVVKMPNSTFYGKRKQATTKFCFFFLTWTIPGNSTPGGFAYICGQSKWLEIIAIKTERAQIYSRLALRQQLHVYKQTR